MGENSRHSDHTTCNMCSRASLCLVCDGALKLGQIIPHTHAIERRPSLLAVARWNHLSPKLHISGPGEHLRALQPSLWRVGGGAGPRCKALLARGRADPKDMGRCGYGGRGSTSTYISSIEVCTTSSLFFTARADYLKCNATQCIAALLLGYQWGSIANQFRFLFCLI